MTEYENDGDNYDEAIDSTETKAQRFSRVATRRLRAALKQMELLENCANTATYEYTDEQVEKIFAFIENATASLKRAYKQETDERELPAL